MQIEKIKADSFHTQHFTVDLKKNGTEPEQVAYILNAQVRYSNIQIYKYPIISKTRVTL